MMQIVRYLELNETVWHASTIDRVVSASSGVEKTVETTIGNVADIPDLNLSKFRRFRLPQRVAVTKADELARIEFRGCHVFNRSEGKLSAVSLWLSPKKSIYNCGKSSLGKR